MSISVRERAANDEKFYAIFPQHLVCETTTEHHFWEFHRPADLPLAVRRDVMEGGDKTGQHHHVDFFALYVIRAGRGVTVINGRPYGVSRGDVHIMPPGSVHEYRDFVGIEADAFYFKAELFSRSELAALRELKGFWKLFLAGARNGKKSQGDPRLHLLPDQHREVEATFIAIRDALAEEAAFGPLLAHHLFFCLLVQLARRHEADYGGEGPHGGEPSGAIGRSAAEGSIKGVADAVRYCEENFEQSITVPQLAAHAFLSAGHFSRLFAAERGMPPGAYLRKLRLERAQNLLVTTSLPIFEIAKLVGLRDPDQLAHAFRGAFGVSPTAYRATFRQ